MPIWLTLLTMITVMAPWATPPGRAAGTVSVLVETRSTPLVAASSNNGAAYAHRWERWEVPVRESIDSTVERLSASLGARVQVDRRYRLLGPESEPLFGDQWGLENTGQNNGLPDADIDASGAWPISTGTGVLVAVVDSGIDPSNQETGNRLWTNPGETPGDGVDNDGNGYVDDVAGWDFTDSDNDPSPEGQGSDDAHGTLIAGIIAGEVNGSGITGIAHDAAIMNIRACDAFCSSYDAFGAIVYAVDNGADIINLSFGAAVPAAEGDWVMEDALDYAMANGVLVVTAAGNTHPSEVSADDVILPAEFPHANNLAVAASDRHDQLAGFSYFSPRIDLAAPGEDIVSIGLDGYYTVSGTSFAAPYVAGVAALMLGKDPGMGYAELSERVKAFADRPAGVGSKVEAGRLNAERALTKPFTDTVGHLFENDIEWAAEEGVTKGCNPPTNTRFCPDDPIERGAMAAFLVRFLGLPQAGSDHFDDDDGSTFEGDINRLAEAGITKGCGPRRFCPDEVVDRGQMAAFLVRAFGLTNAGAGDLFSDDDNSIFEKEIDILGTAGITRGCNPPENDRFCPEQPVDRGAMAAFLHRASSG